MKPYWQDDPVTLYHGDCLDVLAGMPDASVDAIVTDPPAGISFMGKDWDGNLGHRDRWIAWLAERMTQAARVLKPGGHALVWSLPRTAGWTQIACEDAGLEIRDSIAHIFGQGFPKSKDVSKAIDKAAGAAREVVGASPFASRKPNGTWTGEVYGDEPVHRQGPSLTAPATEDASRWAGWGTALKPAHEVWWLARKPLAGTVAANALEYGTGGLNIDACRVTAGRDYRDKRASVVGLGSNRNGDAYGEWGRIRADSAHEAGRWPPNVVLTHSPDCAEDCVPWCPVPEMDGQSGASVSRIGSLRQSAQPGDGYGMTHTGSEYADHGGASRFFPVFRYQAKASSDERPRLEDGTAHCTVKPLGLMRWLVQLVTPPGGLVLDQFAGSGATAEACVIHGFRSVLIEQDVKSCALIRERLRKPIQVDLFAEAAQ